MDMESSLVRTGRGSTGEEERRAGTRKREKKEGRIIVGGQQVKGLPWIQSKFKVNLSTFMRLCLKT